MTTGTIILINIVFFSEKFISLQYYALTHLFRLFLPEVIEFPQLLWCLPFSGKHLFPHSSRKTSMSTPLPSTDLFLLSYMAKKLSIISAIICILLFIPNLAAFMILPPTAVFKWHDFENTPDSMTSLLLSPVVNSQFSFHLAYEWHLSHVTLFGHVTLSPWSPRHHTLLCSFSLAHRPVTYLGSSSSK